MPFQCWTPLHHLLQQYSPVLVSQVQSSIPPCGCDEAGWEWAPWGSSCPMHLSAERGNFAYSELLRWCKRLALAEVLRCPELCAWRATEWTGTAIYNNVVCINIHENCYRPQALWENQLPLMGCEHHHVPSLSPLPSFQEGEIPVSPQHNPHQVDILWSEVFNEGYHWQKLPLSDTVAALLLC